MAWHLSLVNLIQRSNLNKKAVYTAYFICTDTESSSSEQMSWALYYEAGLGVTSGLTGGLQSYRADTDTFY